MPNADHMTNWMPPHPMVNQTVVRAISRVVVCMHMCLMKRGTYVPVSGKMADGDRCESVFTEK